MGPIITPPRRSPTAVVGREPVMARLRADAGPVRVAGGGSVRGGEDRRWRPCRPAPSAGTRAADGGERGRRGVPPEPRRCAGAARRDRGTARRGRCGRRPPPRWSGSGRGASCPSGSAFRGGGGGGGGQRDRPQQPVPGDQRAGRLPLRLHHGRRDGGGRGSDRRRRVRDHGQRPQRPGRRPHPVRQQEVDAGPGDRPRQPHPVCQLRRVGRRGPAPRGQRRRRLAVHRRGQQPGSRPPTSRSRAGSSTR